MDEEMKMLTEVDPVSGNEVPPGALPEEVRDDIDAKLSEGEYVVPADVLRFYGVKFFEDLREKAKYELAEMDSEGRMGGEPAMDLEMEMEAMPEMGMAKGGVVDKMPSASVNMDVKDDTDMLLDQFMDVVKNNPDVRKKLQSRGMNYAEGGVVTKDALLQTMQSMMNQGKVGFAEGGTVEAPTFDPSAYGLGFSLFGKSEPFSPDTNVELTEYVNAAGQSIMIRTVDGSPIDPVPAGYYLPGQEPTATTPKSSSDRNERQMPVQPTVQTAADRTEQQAAKDYYSMSAEELGKEMTTSRVLGQGASIASGLLTGGIGGSLLGGAASAFGKGRILALGDVASKLAQQAREAGDVEGAAAYEAVADRASNVSGPGADMARDYYLNRWTTGQDATAATPVATPTQQDVKPYERDDRPTSWDGGQVHPNQDKPATKTKEEARASAKAAADKLGKPLATGGRATGGLVTKRKK